MVDYSKWDKLDISDDEEERKPQVHKFDKAHSVTLGQKAGEISAAPQGETEVKDEDMEDGDDDEPFETEDDFAEAGQDRREDVLQCRALAERALRDGNPAEGVRLFEKAMRLGGCPGLEDSLQAARYQLAGSQSSIEKKQTPLEDYKTVNGGVVDGRYSWSQTREEVEIFVFVPDGTKAKDVRAEVTETNLKVSVGASTLLAGEWEFKVSPEEDLDWELKDCEGHRAVRLLVRKAVMPGGLSVTVWWSKVLKGEPEIDVKKIQAREGDLQKREKFAKAWGDAHEMFRESLKNRQPIPIDVSGGNEQADEDM
mmetsp:Transcript_17230/g.30214  ORF Transcript_17230/g.30214 Transcript_17230/m.30214 type:complete len:311 (-) Transcript_17230:118-1050(-)